MEACSTCSQRTWRGGDWSPRRDAFRLRVQVIVVKTNQMLRLSSCLRLSPATSQHLRSTHRRYGCVFCPACHRLGQADAHSARSNHLGTSLVRISGLCCIVLSKITSKRPEV